MSFKHKSMVIVRTALRIIVLALCCLDANYPIAVSSITVRDNAIDRPGDVQMDRTKPLFCKLCVHTCIFIFIGVSLF